MYVIYWLKYKNRWFENKSKHRKNINNLCRSCDPCFSLVLIMDNCINFTFPSCIRLIKNRLYALCIILMVLMNDWCRTSCMWGWMGAVKVIPSSTGRAERSPYRAFVHRVHWGAFWTVENTGKLIELGNAADHSAGNEAQYSNMETETFVCFLKCYCL